MDKFTIPRLMLAAPGSSTGKTTLACALLQALKNRGLSPAAFKCGPDYIDPMFHTRILGVQSHNLDLFFTGEETLLSLFAHHSRGRDIALLEGVMGYYDGVGDGTQASSWHLTCVTQTPVLLVLDPKGMSLSAAAVIKGFLELRKPHHIAGVILNRCSQGLYQHLKPMLEQETGLPVLGYLPNLPDCAIKSRHLGLVTAQEVQNLTEKISRLAKALEECVELDRILELAGGAPALTAKPLQVAPVPGKAPVIAVAQDQAFCFYYPDNLELLEALGARLVPFSPLKDKALPEGASALYLGGGYPELHAEVLSQNTPMRREVLRAVQGGIPTLAECGGFQYLQEFLTDARGNRYPMAGAIPGESTPAGRLVRFGYATLTARQDTLLCQEGESIAAHEFHYWDSTQNGEAFLAQKPTGSKSWPCVVAKKNLFAGYPHLYFYSNPSFARNFVQAAEQYSQF